MTLGLDNYTGTTRAKPVKRTPQTNVSIRECFKRCDGQQTTGNFGYPCCQSSFEVATGLPGGMGGGGTENIRGCKQQQTRRIGPGVTMKPDTTRYLRIVTCVT